MKIIKDGQIVPFCCSSCGGEFVVGINAVENYEGNFYANCPICGFECHASVIDIQEYEKKQRLVK